MWYSMVHNNKNCHNLRFTDRIINVKWNTKIDKKFKSVINITGIKKDNLLLDIITKTSSSSINILKVNTINNIQNNIYELTIEVKDINELNKYILDLKQNSDILNVERVFY